MSPFALSLIALFAGFLLSITVYVNGLLAKFIRPLEASLVIHLVGLVAALILFAFWRLPPKLERKTIPNWTYIAGFFGGISVAIIGVTVNGPIGITGTVGLLVLGQVLYSWLNDSFGFFGTPKRKLTVLDFVQAGLILTGVGVLIYG